MTPTLYQIGKELLCTAILEGNDFYQEILRGTDKGTLMPALAARVSYHGSNQIGLYFDVEDKNKIFVGIALTWAFCNYKGIGERVWLKEWSALAFSTVAKSVVNYVTKMGYQKEIKAASKEREAQYQFTPFLSSKSKKRARFVLCTVVAMVQACVLYKLEGDRNPSLPLKPYLYYGAGVVLLNRLNQRYNSAVDLSKLLKNQGMPFPLAVSINSAITNFGLGALTAYVVGRYTGETILVNRKWEALSTIAYDAVFYLFPDQEVVLSA